MGYLDNSTVTVDAILTKQGRKLLAQDSPLNISYFTLNEYQKILTIIPSGNAQNYHIQGKISVQNAQHFHHIYINLALRSQTLPDLDWNVYYNEEYNNIKYVEPLLWTKETTTAGFILAFKVIASTIYGNVTCDIDVIPRFSTLKSDIKLSSDSPDLADKMLIKFSSLDNFKAFEVSEIVPIWLGLIKIEFIAFFLYAFLINFVFVTTRSSPTIWR